MAKIDQPSSSSEQIENEPREDLITISRKSFKEIIPLIQCEKDTIINVEKKFAILLIQEIQVDLCFLFSKMSKELQGDKEVVMEAVKNDGHSLEFASKELQGIKR